MGWDYLRLLYKACCYYCRRVRRVIFDNPGKQIDSYASLGSISVARRDNGWAITVSRTTCRGIRLVAYTEGRFHERVLTIR